MNDVTPLAALRLRLAKAEADRDTWRAAGREEQYMAAYFLVESLQLQIEQLLLPTDDHASH